jgi:hypothetical protein
MDEQGPQHHRLHNQVSLFYLFEEAERHQKLLTYTDNEIHDLV